MAADPPWAAIKVGDRVKVHAPTRCHGSDHDCHGRAGTVLKIGGGWIAVQLDKPPRYWRNPAIITSHHLRPAGVDAAATTPSKTESTPEPPRRGEQS